MKREKQCCSKAPNLNSFDIGKYGEVVDNGSHKVRKRMQKIKKLLNS
jgi:hypothetical protein